MPIADIGAYSITSSARASTIGGTVKAECLRGLEVDDQLVLVRQLHRQIGWLLALEDAVDIAGGLPELVDDVGPVANQPANTDETTEEVNRGQFVPCCQCNDQFVMSDRRCASCHDQAAIGSPREGGNCPLDLAGVTYVDWARLDAERRRKGLNGTEHTGADREGGIANGRDAGQCRARFP